MARSSNFNFGLALGIVSASVFLALSGCATSPGQGGSSAAPAAASSPSAAALSPFSEPERERILAVQGIVEAAASEHHLDPDLVNAVIWVESKFEPEAKSSAGARGLMQLMPATAAYLAKRMGEHNPRSYDPEFNVRAGTLYLAQMMETFGDERHAVAAYHAGPGNVKRWLDNGDEFPEYSQTYVAKVWDARARFEGGDSHGGTSAARKPGGATTMADPKTEAPRIESDDEPLEAPDLATIPTVAEVYARASVDEVEAPSAPVVVTLEIEDLGEPVFVVHDELDANPQARSGWVSPPSETTTNESRRSNRSKTRAKPEPKPKPEPEPKAEPKPEPESEPEPAPEPEPEPAPDAGIGVLPDL